MTRPGYQRLADKIWEDKYWAFLIIAASNLGGVVTLLSIRYWGYDPDMLLWTAGGQGIGFLALAFIVLLREGKP